jgi:hypothetical protein
MKFILKNKIHAANRSEKEAMELGFVGDDDAQVSYLPDEPGEGDRQTFVWLEACWGSRKNLSPSKRRG